MKRKKEQWQRRDTRGPTASSCEEPTKPSATTTVFATNRALCSVCRNVYGIQQRLCYDSSIVRRAPVSAPRKIAHFAFIVLLLLVILPIAIIAIVLHVLNTLFVYLLVWVWWLPSGKDVLYVTSDSPVWKDYMETEVFPLVAQRAKVLNWSARSKWPKWSFDVRVFRFFGGGRNFNPMVVLFRPFHRARIFRFLPAFREHKHGNSASVEQLRRDLMQAL